MVKVGNLVYEQRTLQLMKQIGAVTPVLTLLYGLLVAFGLVSSHRYVGSGVFIALSGAWLMFGVYQYIYPPQTKNKMIFNIGLYHIFAIIYILTVSGFTAPLVTAWALLYLASYTYFSYAGFILSAYSFFVVMFIDILLSPANTESYFYSIGAGIVTVFVAVGAIRLSRIKEHDRETIAKSKRNESLQQDRLLTLVNNLADAIISTDSNGKIQIYNAAFLNLLDTNVSVIGSSIDEVLRLSDEDTSAVSLVPLLKEARSVVVNDALKTKVGDEIIRVEITYSPVRGSYSRTLQQDTEDGYVVIMRDITKAKSLEEERDEFISVVSHELRTPIAIAEGALDNARIIFNKDTSKKELVSSTMTTAHEQVIFLARMVNDLSTLSRAERGVADASELIDVKELAHALLSEYAPQAEKKGLRLNLSAHGKLGNVTASRLYLQELLQNFITNSIKYTKEGHIDLVIEAKNGHVNFAVTDTGIGISKADQIKIFQKFYRSEDYRTRETGGTGLGLYVAQKLSKKLGCTIDVKSRLNYGSTFSFSLAQSSESPAKTTESA